MKHLSKNRLIIWIVEFIIGEILSLLIQKCFNYNGNKMSVKEIIDNAIIIGSLITITIMGLSLFYWIIKDKYKKMKFDIMSNKLYIRLVNHKLNYGYSLHTWSDFYNGYVYTWIFDLEKEFNRIEIEILCRNNLITNDELKHRGDI